MVLLARNDYQSIPEHSSPEHELKRSSILRVPNTHMTFDVNGLSRDTVNDSVRLPTEQPVNFEVPFKVGLNYYNCERNHPQMDYLIGLEHQPNQRTDDHVRGRKPVF